MSTLVLRAWLESGHPQLLRVRITRIEDGRELGVTTATTIDSTSALVRTWLEETLEAWHR